MEDSERKEWVDSADKKKTVRMAPALLLDLGNIYSVSILLFKSEQEAKDTYLGDDETTVVKWPASENLWVEVEI